MTLTERKKRSEAFAEIEKELGKIYPLKTIKGRNFFQNENGILFFVSEFPGEYALVVEYAENEEEAKKYCFEDGDRFYLDELSGDKLLNAMLEEINA